MGLPPPRSTRTEPLFPYTTPLRSRAAGRRGAQSEPGGGAAHHHRAQPLQQLREGLPPDRPGRMAGPAAPARPPGPVVQGVRRATPEKEKGRPRPPLFFGPTIQTRLDTRPVQCLQVRLARYGARAHWWKNRTEEHTYELQSL